MTAINYSRTDPFSATRPTIANRVINWTLEAFRAWKNRRAFYRLGEMTDVELHDIGLTRGDLAIPSDLPFTYDPTSNLGKVARHRSRLMEAAARSVC